MTLREYIAHWQETYDRHQSRPTTYAAHNYVFKNHKAVAQHENAHGTAPYSFISLFSTAIIHGLTERDKAGKVQPSLSDFATQDSKIRLRPRELIVNRWS